MPTELQEHILDELGFPLRMEKAKALRLELMDERKLFERERTRELLSHTLWNSIGCTAPVEIGQLIASERK